MQHPNWRREALQRFIASSTRHLAVFTRIQGDLTQKRGRSAEQGWKAIDELLFANATTIARIECDIAGATDEIRQGRLDEARQG